MSEEYKNHEDPLIAAANKAIEGNVTEEPVKKEIKDVVPEGNDKDVETIVPDTIEEVKTPEEDGKPDEAHIESEPKKEDDTAQEDVAAKADKTEVSNFDDWDTTTEDVTTEDTKEAFDYKALAEEIGVEAATKEDIVEAVKKIKEEKAQSTEFVEGLPDDLKKAIEIAQLDGDYLQYLGVTSVDYNNVDDATLVQNQYAAHLTDANGNVDVEKLAEVMESLSDLDIEMKGKELRARYIGDQEAFKAKVQREAQEAKQEADKELRAALEGMSNVRDFKLNGAHKKSLYEGISSGNMVQELFYGSDGKMDYKKVAKAYFNHLYGDKVDKFMRQRIQTSTKKELLNKLSNKQIEPKGGEFPNAKKVEQNSQQELAEYLREGGTIF